MSKSGYLHKNAGIIPHSGDKRSRIIFVSQTYLCNPTVLLIYSFLYCPNLTAVHIPDSVTYIGYQAFSACSNLTAIHIPDSVFSIEAKAFYDCKSLTSVEVPAGADVHPEAFDKFTRVIRRRK